ncbi:hypothetical protein ACHQM5_019193 [Ranunculus cassubicifolius]
MQHKIEMQITTRNIITSSSHQPKLMVKTSWHFDLAVKITILLICTASLLLLPLFLPPLPPPPFVFLLLPVCILVVLMLVAVFPSHVANIAVSPV